MKKSLLLAVFLLCFHAFAQNTHTISGYVEDAASKERLIGVNVYIPGTTYGTSTNTYGFYSLSPPEDIQIITVSFIGYQTINDTINFNDSNVNLDFKLEPLSQELATAEVTAEEIAAKQVQASTITLSAKEIKQVPSFFGEVDVIRALQLMPGVQSGTEGTTGLYVRGGSPDQNLILLDGVPVYNASHLLGVFSVFNADAIKNVKLTKDGFPAQYGGRLSSVLEIDLKEGNMKEFHGEGAIGLISSKLTLEGPIVKNKTSFILSGRRMYYDLLLQPFLQKGYSTGYYFGDFNAKVNHIFSKKDRLYLSFYGGENNFYNKIKSTNFYYGRKQNFTESSGLKWGNRTASLRWNHLFSDKLFSNLTSTYTYYKFTVGKELNSTYTIDSLGSFSSNTINNYISNIEDYGLKYDLSYSLNSKHSLMAGANYTYHSFRPGAYRVKDSSNDSTLNFSSPLYAHDLYAYLQDDWIINTKLRAHYGAHYSTYKVGSRWYQSLQPRVSFRYLLGDNWSVKGSYALMNQYVHLLSNSGIDLPTDIWVSSTEKIKPQISQQVVLGSTKNILGNNYEISVEGYYKWMSNLIAYKEGESFISLNDWQESVETNGKGEMYGAELLFRKKLGKTTGWLGYTLAWSNRQFSNINQGYKYPYKYDRRHDLSLVINHKFSDRFNMGFSWVYNTGNTFTAPISNISLNEDSEYNTDWIYSNSIYTQYEKRNGSRMPDYHRLDVSLNFVKRKKWGERIWNISFYNAYARNNPFYIELSQDESGKPQAYQVSIFPIIPSFSYIFKF